MSPLESKPPPLWPLLVLCAAVAVGIDLGTLHRCQYADSLLPALISLQRWTPFFWEQDRIGMLVPLLAVPFKHPLVNLLVQDAVNVFAGLAGLILLARYMLRDVTYAVVGLLSAAAFVALTPAYYRFEYLVNTYYGVWLALGLGGLILIEPRPDGSIPWRRRLLALLLLLLAHWVYCTASLYLGLVVGLRWLCVRPALWQRGGFWVWLRNAEVAVAFQLLALGTLFGFAIMPAVPADVRTKFYAVPLTEWPHAWGALLDNTWTNLGPPLWPVLLLTAAAAGLLLLWIPALRRHAALPLRAALALVVAALVLGFFFGTRAWVRQNLYMFRFLQPSCLFLQAALLMLAAAPLAAALSSRARQRLTLTAALLLGAGSVYQYGLPSLPGVRADLAQHHISTCTSVDPLAGIGTEDILAAGCTHIAGDYYYVWPAVYTANLALYERGERRVVWGVTYRCEPTRSKLRRIPPERIAVAIAAGGDRRAEHFAFVYGLPSLVLSEKRPTAWILRPRR